MTNVKTRTKAPSRPTATTVARASVAALLALAAPAVSFLPALTTNVHGSGAQVTFPHGYPLMLAVTVVVTMAACAAGALLAKRAALLAIPAGLALWVVIGLAVLIAALALGSHAHLAEWGIAFIAAAAAGAAAGLPLATRRPARSSVPGLPRSAHLPPSRP